MLNKKARTRKPHVLALPERLAYVRGSLLSVARYPNHEQRYEEYLRPPNFGGKIYVNFT